MVIFLRPVIIRNEDGYKALTNQRYRYIMDQENAVAAKGNALLPDIKAVTIENQVPYNNIIPTQAVVNPPSEPIIDLRPLEQNAQPVPTVPNLTSSANSKSSIIVKQPSSNSVIITNN